MTGTQLLAIGLSYLCGAIPFGLLAGWIARKDIRKEGSGNIGATNVLRVCGPAFGIPVFILDFAKGLAPALVAAHLFPDRTLIAVCCAVASILGHNFPVWLRFKGGKGVATSAGALAAILPYPLLIALVIFIIVVAIGRMISLGSLCAAATLPVAHLVLCYRPLSGEPVEPFTGNALPLTVMALVLCVLVFLRHRANIGRLLAGTENRLGQKKESERTETPTSTETPNQETT